MSLENNISVNSRFYLLLQGVASPFFSELEKALNKAEHNVLKINFCGGDLLSGRFFSTALKHVNYREKLDLLPEFYTKIFAENKVTDIILFGDTRPVHFASSEACQEEQSTHSCF